MSMIHESFVKRMELMQGTQPCGCDPCCPEDTGSADGPWMVTVTYHSAGSAILRRTMENIGYRDTDPGYNGIEYLPAGTELEVLEADVFLTWYRVRTPSNEEGWIFGARTQYLSGLCRGHPFVDRWDIHRDGSPEKALEYAIDIVQNGELKGTDFANRCLSFVNTCYNIAQVPTRCPLMANPGRCGHPGNAIGAFRALWQCGKILLMPQPVRFPPGAIVFWDVSDVNGGHGHIALVGHNGCEVITSGFIRNNGIPTAVQTMTSVFRVAEWTNAPFLGYTTAEIAFTPGTWGAGASSEAETETETEAETAS